MSQLKVLLKSKTHSSISISSPSGLCEQQFLIIATCSYVNAVIAYLAVKDRLTISVYLEFQSTLYTCMQVVTAMSGSGHGLTCHARLLGN